MKWDWGIGEGWCLSERSDGFYEIQRNDDDGDEFFDSDFRAFVHVRQLAEAGSAMHRDALSKHGTRWPK